MTAPLGADLDLQIAIVAALEASADLQLLTANPVRMYQSVPSNPIFPYITLGEAQQIDDSAACLTASEIFPVVHVWSRSASGSFREAKQIADAVKKALHFADLTLSENDFDLISFDRADVMRDPDGLTRHIALVFRALVNET